MATTEDGAGDVDLYAGVDDFSAEAQNPADGSDLYEDVLTSKTDDKAEAQFLASQDDQAENVEYKSYTTVHPKSALQQQKEAKIAANLHHDRRGKAVYVGNLTWWTTDEELTSRIQDCGVTDLNNIKFFENRVNGQSKGFALVEVGSETSQRLLMEKLPKQDVHDQKPVVTYVTKHSLANFEQMSRKVKPGVGAAGGDFKNVTDSSGLAPGVIGRAHMNRPGGSAPPHNNKQGGFRPNGPPPHEMGFGMPYMGPGGPPMRHMGPGMPPMMNGPPFDPAFHGFMPGMPLPGMPPMQPDPAFMMQQGFPPAGGLGFPTSAPNRMEFPGGFPQAPNPPVAGGGPHGGGNYMPHPEGNVPVSDAFGRVGGAPMPGNGSQQVDPMAYQRSGYPVMSASAESEMESMRYNQAVASTALQRAMADANAGDFETGIETLVTAISLIKQSGTSNSDSSSSLVLSLQDCLHRLEAQLITRATPSSRSKERSGGFSPSDEFRDDRRSSHRRRHRSRSRSRSRDRRSWSPREGGSRSRERRRR